MYTEICAEPGEAIAAVSSTPGIQFHRISSLLGKHDQWPVEKALLNRRIDLNKGPSYFRPPAARSDRTPKETYSDCRFLRKISRSSLCSGNGGNRFFRICMLFGRTTGYRLAQHHCSYGIPAPEDQNNHADKKCKRNCKEGPDIDVGEVRPGTSYRFEVRVRDCGDNETNQASGQISKA